MATILPPIILPEVVIVPAVRKLPPVTLPVAVIVPAVSKLPPVTLPVEETTPPVNTLPPVTLPEKVGLVLTPKVTVSDAADPTMVMLLLGVNVRMPLAELATMLTPLALTVEKLLLEPLPPEMPVKNAPLP